MKHLRFRHTRFATSAPLALLLLGACQDGVVATAPAERVAQIDATAEIRRYPEGKTHTFTILPGVPTSFRVGDHTISFDANSVCATNSTYGPTEWDKPCTPIARPVQIQIKSSRDSLGRPRIDFAPKLRFVPGKEVMLDLFDRTSAELEREVLWCPDNSGDGKSKQCVNEGAFDVQMRTRHDKPTGHLLRRLKHFSGYEVAAT